MSDAPVLLPYQQRLLRALDEHQVVVCEKSRRIGYTWGAAAKAALVASARKGSGGQDVLYIGYNLEMAREFIDVCAMWARNYAAAAVEVHETVFRDVQGDDTRDIQAFRINFGSGFEILALSSRPRSLRGKQGMVIIDEAAFHDDLRELLKAAFALLIWGGQVCIISTHDGDDNPFNELVQEVRAGKKPYALLRVTFDEAIAEGLYRRICEVTKQHWSPEGEAAWAQKIRYFYGDASEEELDCVPRKSGGKYLSRVLLESRAVDAPVFTLALDDAFVDLSIDEGSRRVLEWLEEHVAPVITTLPPGAASFIGEDFGRSGDLSIQWPLIVGSDLRRRTPFVIELQNVPFREQEQVFMWLASKLPRFSGAALDARGNGQYLAEQARRMYGEGAVAEVMLSERWYLENMPRMKAALEDGTLELPRHAATIDDFRAIEVVKGVPRVVERTIARGADGKRQQRHGDAAIACVLAYHASEHLDGARIEGWSVEGQNVAAEAFGGGMQGDSW